MRILGSTGCCVSVFIVLILFGVGWILVGYLNSVTALAAYIPGGVMIFGGLFLLFSMNGGTETPNS